MRCHPDGDLGKFHLCGSRLTINGDPQTVATACEYLASIELRPRMYRRMVRCNCDSGPCDNVPTVELPGGAWSHCPMYILRSPWWRTIVALWQQLAVCGRIDPDRLAAWAVFGVMTLKRRIDDGHRSK